MSYKRFFLVRLAWALFGAWFAVTLVFWLFFVVPVRPERLIAGPQAPSGALERARDEFGLDEPLYQQYGDYLRRLVTEQSAGRSPAIEIDSRTVALRATPATLSLLAFGLVVILGLGVPLGLLAARLQEPRMLGRFLVYLAVGMSPIWLGVLLSYFVGYKLRLTPLGGYCDLIQPSTDCGGVRDWAQGLILPGFTFGLFFAAVYARVVAHIAPVGERLARRKILLVARMLGRDFGYSLSAVMLVEVVFGVPGLGAVFYASLNAFDVITVQSVLIMALLLAIGFHLLVDLVVGALDSDLRAKWPVASVTGRA